MQFETDEKSDIYEYLCETKNYAVGKTAYQELCEKDPQDVDSLICHVACHMLSEGDHRTDTLTIELSHELTTLLTSYVIKNLSMFQNAITLIDDAYNLTPWQTALFLEVKTKKISALLFKELLVLKN